MTQLDGKLYQAPVYIDGKRSGSSPIFARPLSPGTHRIEVLHANYAPIRRTVTVSPNKTSKLIVHLKKR